MQPIFVGRAQASPQRSRVVLCRGRGRARAARGANRGGRKAGHADSGRPAGGDRAAHQAPRPAIRIGEHVTRRQPGARRSAIANTGRPTTQLTERNGVTAQYAKLEMRRRTTLIGAMLLKKGEADGMICGTISTTARHLHYIDQVIGQRAGASVYGAMSGLILPGPAGVHRRHARQSRSDAPNSSRRLTQLAADQLSAFGLVPKVALLSHSNFGSSNAPSAVKMRTALALLRARMPELEVDGEMHGDGALDEARAARSSPDSTLQRQRQSAGVSEPRQRQHRVQSAEIRGRPQCRDRSDTARVRGSGAHPDAGCHGAPHRQHDSHYGGRSEQGAWCALSSDRVGVGCCYRACEVTAMRHSKRIRDFLSCAIALCRHVRRPPSRVSAEPPRMRQPVRHSTWQHHPGDVHTTSGSLRATAATASKITCARCCCTSGHAGRISR